MTVDDEALWRRALRGEGEAFGLIFDRHRNRVRRHAVGLVPVAADADDVVAVVFFEAWRKRETIRFVDGSILPWLLRTATFTASNLSRAARRYGATLQRLPPTPETVGAASPETEDADVVIALRQLPLRDQQILTFCVLEDYSPEQAASVLGIRAGTARTRLTRAKTRLRHRLDPETRQLRTQGAIHVN